MIGLDLANIDLGHLALFVGLRMNQLVLEQLTRAGFAGLRESHGYLIQHLIDAERSITELAKRMSVSQQAVSKVVAELIRLGILEVNTAEDRRSKVIRLSKRGWNAVHRSRKCRAAISRRIERELGAAECERTRASLVACLNIIGGAESVRTRRVKEPD